MDNKTFEEKIKIILGQTDLTEEEASKKLLFHNENYIFVIREWLKTPVKIDKKKSERGDENGDENGDEHGNKDEDEDETKPILEEEASKKNNININQELFRQMRKKLVITGDNMKY